MLEKLPVLALAAFLACAMAAVAGASAPTGSSSSVALSGSLQPQPDGTYLYDGTIRDLGSGEILASPRIRFTDGETATTTLGSTNQDSLKLTLSADREKGTATVDLSRTRKGRSVTIQHLDFRLK